MKEKLIELKKKLEQRLIRLSEFSNVPEIQEHGVPEVKWILEEVNKILIAHEKGENQ